MAERVVMSAMLDAAVASGPRVRLRRWRSSDRAPFAAINADRDVMRYFPGPMTRTESDAFADRIEAHFDCDGFGFGTLALAEVVSFTVPANLRSRRVMERLSMTRDPADDFAHPAFPPVISSRRTSSTDSNVRRSLRPGTGQAEAPSPRPESDFLSPAPRAG